MSRGRPRLRGRDAERGRRRVRLSTRVGPKRTLDPSRKCERAFTNAYGSQPHARAGGRVECAVVTHRTSAVMTHRTSARVRAVSAPLTSFSGEPAVDRQRDTGDERRLLGGQKQSGGRAFGGS